jgi:hypothetical protein
MKLFIICVLLATALACPACDMVQELDDKACSADTINKQLAAAENPGILAMEISARCSLDRDEQACDCQTAAERLDRMCPACAQLKEQSNFARSLNGEQPTPTDVPMFSCYRDCPTATSFAAELETFLQPFRASALHLRGA